MAERAQRFKGLTVVITGAAGGLGQAFAAGFAAAGARLVLGDRDGAAAGRVAAAYGAQAVAMAADVTVEADMEAMARMARDHFGSLDVAINNAGIGSPFARLTEVSLADARRTLEVNTIGVFLGMKHQIRTMEALGRSGAIVNIASAAGVGGAPKIAIYAASKHAVVGLTRSAALEYARRGIRINAVCPSFTRTPMLDDLASAAPQMTTEELVRGIPMRRLGTPQEVAEAVMFAADPSNSFMTGHVLSVDGGLSAM